MSDLLFNGPSINQVLDARLAEMQGEITQASDDYVLKVNPEKFIEHLVDKYRVEVPVLELDRKSQLAPREQPRTVDNYGRSMQASATQLVVIVPFLGQKEIFRCVPTHSRTPRPEARVDEAELRLTYTQVDHNPKHLTELHARDVQNIEYHLNGLRSAADEFNSKLVNAARETFDKRRARVVAALELAAALNIPLARSAKTSDTYTVPIIRRVARIERPTVSNRPWTPDPTLDAADYEFILGLIDRMAEVIERSPNAVAVMDEESLRFLFLVPLNSHFDRGASGETFNFKGKTDILLRHQDGNVFVAECKIWEGARALTKAIGQLLGYLTWRDTKAALLVFNRNKDFTSVVTQLPGIVSKHPCFVQDQGQRSPTSFRFLLHQPNDKERFVNLTVMAFDVPTP